MKRLLASAALLALFASPAAALTLWQGDMFVTAVNNAASCNAVNVAVGDYARSVFRPKNLTDNGPNDLLSFIQPRSAVQVVPTGGTLDGAASGTVRIIYGSAGFNQFGGVAFSGVNVAPPAPAPGTPIVTIQITIANHFSKNPATPSGCNATYTGRLAKRP